MTEPYFEKDEVTLYAIDCIRGMQDLIKPRSVDVIVTSPPYNIGAKYNSYKDTKPRERYLDWMEDVGCHIKTVLADDGSFFLNIGGTLKDQWIPFDIINRMRDDFVLQNTIHWTKSIAIMKKDIGKKNQNMVDDLIVGHYKPIGGKRFVYDAHEYIFHLTKRGDVELDRLAIGVPYQDKSNIDRWKKAGRDLRDRGNNWFIPYETIWDKEQRPHPATFPISLPEMCVKLHGLGKVKTVLDPFMGIGSTALACIKLNKRFIGFEIDKKYLDVAALRIREFNQPAFGEK